MTDKTPNAMYSKDLQCCWVAWVVVGDGHLHLVVKEGECPSMSGATRIAEQLCPVVYRIDVFQGKKPDGMYFKFGTKGKWHAMTAKALDTESEPV